MASPLRLPRGFEMFPPEFEGQCESLGENDQRTRCGVRLCYRQRPYQEQEERCLQGEPYLRSFRRM